MGFKTQRFFMEYNLEKPDNAEHYNVNQAL